MRDSLRGKKALVTGGARRVGRAVCMKLAEEGVDVAFSYRTSSPEAEGTVRELQRLGIRTTAIRADLTRMPDCRSLLRRALDYLGGIDILVNNASTFPKTPVEELAHDEETFERSFGELVSLHMRAPLYLGIHLGLEMKRSGWGRIVSLTDRVTASGQAYPGWSLYLASKYGLFGLTQALAAELAPEVNVNTVAPGLVVPPPGTPEVQTRRLIERVPLKRQAGPDEIAADVLHLIKSESKTGATLVTDGGENVLTDHN